MLYELRKMIKKEIIEKCIDWTGIEDGKTCLDRQGVRDLANDVWKEAQKEAQKKLLQGLKNVKFGWSNIKMYCSENCDKEHNLRVIVNDEIMCWNCFIDTYNASYTKLEKK